MNKLYLIILLLVGCSVKEPVTPEKLKDGFRKRLPANAQNINPIDNHWTTFTLNIDGKEHKFLAHWSPGPYCGYHSITEINE